MPTSALLLLLPPNSQAQPGCTQTLQQAANVAASSTAAAVVAAAAAVTMRAAAAALLQTLLDDIVGDGGNGLHLDVLKGEGTAGALGQALCAGGSNCTGHRTRERQSKDVERQCKVHAK